MDNNDLKKAFELLIEAGVIKRLQSDFFDHEEIAENIVGNRAKCYALIGLRDKLGTTDDVEYEADLFVCVGSALRDLKIVDYSKE